MSVPLARPFEASDSVPGTRMVDRTQILAEFCSAATDLGGAVGDAGSVTEVLEALERTWAAGSARIALLVQYGLNLPGRSGGGEDPSRRRRVLPAVAKVVGKPLVNAFMRRFDPLNQASVGHIDFVRRRYMLDFGHYAWLYADETQWSGRSGRPVATLPPRSDEVPTPLWLLDLLAGVTRAAEAGTQEVYGTPCRRFEITADLSQAPRAAPGGLAAPRSSRFEDLLALPAEVWLDEHHVRRVRFRRSEQQMETVQFVEFGVSLDDLDWTRLPTFRSPEEAAKVRRRADPGGVYR